MFSRNIQKYQVSLNFKILFQNNPYFTSLLCSGSLSVKLLRFGKVVLQTSIGFSMSSLQILQNGNLVYPHFNKKKTYYKYICVFIVIIFVSYLCRRKILRNCRCDSKRGKVRTQQLSLTPKQKEILMTTRTMML